MAVEHVRLALHLIRTRLLEIWQRRQVKMADMDAWWAGYVVTVPGMAGSWLSFLYYGAGIWALISVALRRFPISIARPARPFVYACLAYFAAMLLAGVLNGNLAELPHGIAPASAFLFLPLLVARLRFSNPERAWRMFCNFAPLGVLAGAIVGGFQLYTGAAIRGGAGNPNVYAVVMADLGVFSLASVFVRHARLRAVCLAAFLLAALAVLASEARSIWPAVVLTPLLLAWFVRPRLKSDHVRAIVAALVMIVVLVGVLGQKTIVKGYDDALFGLEMIGEERYDTSLGMRIGLYGAGFEAAKAQPLLGYGPQNKMDAISGYLDERLAYLSFSHLHNAALDTWVAAGVLGLLALAALFLAPLRFFNHANPRESERRFALYSHLVIFALCSTTGAPFTHDLLTVCFLLPLAILAATVSDTSSGRSRASSMNAESCSDPDLPLNCHPAAIRAVAVSVTP